MSGVSTTFHCIPTRGHTLASADKARSTYGQYFAWAVTRPRAFFYHAPRDAVTQFIRFLGVPILIWPDVFRLSIRQNSQHDSAPERAQAVHESLYHVAEEVHYPTEDTPNLPRRCLRYGYTKIYGTRKLTKETRAPTQQHSPRRLSPVL